MTEKEGKIILIIIVLKELEYRKQVVHSAIAHPLTDVSLVLKQQPLTNFSPGFYILSIISYGMEYLFGQLGSAVPKACPLKLFFCIPNLLAGWAA